MRGRDSGHLRKNLAGLRMPQICQSRRAASGQPFGRFGVETLAGDLFKACPEASPNAREIAQENNPGAPHMS
jgi:hypothetical protein